MVGIFAVEGHYKSTSGKGAELNRLIFMPNAHHLSGVLLLISAQTSQALTRKQTQQLEENVQRRGRGAAGVCFVLRPAGQACALDGPTEGAGEPLQLPSREVPTAA